MEYKELDDVRDDGGSDRGTSAIVSSIKTPCEELLKAKKVSRFLNCYNAIKIRRWPRIKNGKSIIGCGWAWL